ELREPADLEVFDQYVRACRQLLDDAPAILALEIELDRTFAAVGGMEISGAEMVAVGVLDKRRPPAPRVVAGALALDLDDVATETGKKLPSPGPRQDAGKFEYA